MKSLNLISPESMHFKQLPQACLTALLFGLTLLQPFKLFAQAPTISYSSPQTYTAGTAITPLAPTSSGVAAPGKGSSQVTIGSGFNHPYGVAVDAAGNVYVADSFNNAIKKIPVGGGAPVILGSGFQGPEGVAVDLAGNVYVADFWNGAVKKIPAGGGAPVTLGYSGYPIAVAVDAAGNVFATDGYTLEKIPAGGGIGVFFGTGFFFPSGVAVDATGNVYFTDNVNNTVEEIPVGGSVPKIIASGLNNPNYIAVYGAGNVFVGNNGNNTIIEVPAGGGSPITFASGFGLVEGVAADAAGNVYTADASKNLVQKSKLVGGYYLNTALPAGMRLNDTTGVLSGTPIINSPGQNYKITAYNASGSTSATVNIKVDLPPLPTIKYNSPPSYTAGIAIAALAPATSGVDAPGYSTFPVSLSPGVSNATGVAVDALGNIYLAEEINRLVQKIPAGGGAPVTIVTGAINPYSIAVDAAGNVYVGDLLNNGIIKLPVGGGAPVSISYTGNPYGLAFDAAGNLYVADNFTGLNKIPVGGGAPVTLYPGYLTGVAVDAAGNVYVADYGNSAVKEIPVGGGAAITLGSGFNFPSGIAVDASGNIFVNDGGNSQIKEIPAGSVTPVIVGSVYGDGLAIDGAGIIYETAGDIEKIVPVGGYYINKALPAGLSFNNTTGVINGTPIAGSPAKKYTITAYNAAGSRSAVVNIKVVSNNADLANLVLSSGTLAPAFAAGTTSYTDGVDIATTSVSLTPTVSDANATVKVNGTTVMSGAASASIPLAVGRNTITIVITAQDGVTKKTYTVIIGRGDAGLAGLTTSAGALTPDFATGTTAYTAVVSGATTSITVTPTVSDATSAITVNGKTVLSGAASAPITLSVGLNTINTVVTAQNGITTKTYTITAGKGLRNAFLSNLVINKAKLSPAFHYTTNNYTARVPYAISTIRVSAVAAYASATIKINGAAVASNTLSAAIPLAVGPNIITTIVTAQNGVSTDTYTLTVTRTTTNNDYLSSLSLTNPYAVLTSVAGPDFRDYTASVDNSATSIQVIPVANVSASTITVNGVAVTSGSASAPIALNVGANVITTVVTAQDGKSTKSFVITVTRALSNNAGLIDLSLSAGTLSPVFSYYYFNYNNYYARVGINVTSLTVTPTTYDSGATVTVNGTAVNSGTASGPIALSVGANLITIVVTAADRITTRTYTVSVSRLPSSDATLSALTLSSGVLTPAFNSGQNYYTAIVSSTEQSIKVTPTSSDSTATITINGTAVKSGSSSGVIALNKGLNPITIAVVSPDGFFGDTYTLTVSRGSTNADLSNLSISTGTLAPTFHYTTTGYTATVPYRVTSIKVTPTAADPTATIKVNGATVISKAASGAIALKVGTNVITTVVSAQNGVSTATYTLTVTRAAPATNDYLSSISLTKPYAALTVVSGPDFKDYTASVSNATTSIKVIPVTADPTATIKVNGTAVISGSPSGHVTLKIGPNSITTVVTAQDGVSTKSYVITITRATGPVPIATPQSYVENTTGNPQNDGIIVHQGVSPNGDGANDVLTIDGITNYPDNKLMIMNRNGVLVYEAKGYDNSSRVFDGHSNKTGQLQQPGTYFYSLDYKVAGVNKHKTGFIVLKW